MSHRLRERLMTRQFARVTLTAARWIIAHGRALIADGVGEDTRMIDEVPLDTPIYHYMQECIRLLMTIVGILEHEVNEIESEYLDIEPGDFE